MERDDREGPPSLGVVVDTGATDLAREYTDRRGAVVISIPPDAPRPPPFGDRRLEVVIIDDPITAKADRMMRDGFTLAELRAFDADLAAREYNPASVVMDPAVFGEPIMPTMPFRSEREPRERRRPWGWPLPRRRWGEFAAPLPSDPVAAARERGRRLAELWRAKRARRRERKLAGITRTLTDLGPELGAERTPRHGWQDRVLAADQETR